MYDWLLFLHLLAAFLLAVTVVTYTAVALGAATGGRTLFVADRCWDVGGLGTLILGIWLALHLDEYDFWDGWILGAIALWFVATGLGQSTQRRLAADPGADIAVMHWLRTLTVLGLLVLMVWEARRMTVLGAIRPDDWNLPLFLHILGAMALVGSLVLVVLSLVSARRGDSAAGLRLAYRSLLLGVIPSWILMRVGAQWIASKEGLDDLEEPPAWVDIGFVTSEPTLLLLIAATVCAGVAARRAREGGRAFGGLNTAALVLVSITLLAYVLAIWAMSTKPV